MCTGGKSGRDPGRYVRVPPRTGPVMSVPVGVSRCTTGNVQKGRPTSHLGCPVDVACGHRHRNVQASVGGNN